MTENFPHSAAQNIALLEAIQQGPAESLSQLAARADVAVGNMNRKLTVLTEDGLIVSVGTATHQVALTEAGEQALRANAVFRGESPAPGVATAGVTEIPFNLIDAWAGNPRTQFDPAKTEELAISIGDKGVLQAIKVRPKGDRYEVIIGERRRRASALAVQRGLQPADFAIPAEIRDYSDEEAEEVAGVENMQREDMHWMDEAKWYLSLSHRHSGPSIERLVGGIRGKRSIQDYIKCARELSPQDVAKTYLPDGDKDQLTYVRARDLVGEKKERPALELSAKAARALVELIHRGLEDSGVMDLPKVGTTVTTMMWSAPSGGPLNTISLERKLTTFGFENRACVARTVLTETIHAWLTQIGFADDREAALFKVRAAELGELQAGTYGPGAYVTPELNEPEPAASPPPPPPIVQDAEGGEDADIPPFLRRLAGDYSEPQSAAQPAGPTPQRMVEAPPTGAAAASPPPPAPAPLPAMLEIIVVELAHKMGAATMKSPAGGFGAPVLADYYKDNRIGQLVQGWKLLGVHPAGEKTLAIQTDAARAFLVDDYGLEEIDGRVTLDDAVLEQAQMRLLGVKPSPGPYSTPWLNPPPKVETPEAEPELELADPLTPSQRRVLREIAARSVHRHRLLDGWVLAHAAATEDPDFQALYDLELITRKQAGEGEIEVALTLGGRDHLKTRGQAPQDGLSRNSCATPWLREALPAAPAAEAETEDEFDRIGRLAGEARALNSLASAARQAAELLTKLKSRTKAPKAEEIDPMVRLLETALEACAHLLPKDEG